MKGIMNFFFASALFVALMAAAGGSAWAQSNAAELKTYLQQLEVDKMQHKNNPARYQEYENKIASIKKELGMSATNSTTEPTKNDVATQPQETEQARMARTLSATDYDKWKLAQQTTAPPTHQLKNVDKSARVVGTNSVVQQGGLKIATHENGQNVPTRQKSNDVKEMSAIKKAIYKKYGLNSDISKEEMIQWRKDNPEKWQSMRQDLRNSIANQK